MDEYDLEVGAAKSAARSKRAAAASPRASSSPSRK